MTDSYGFELIREREIPEINTRARIYRHIRTGAELISMENSDENKVFGITFATPPTDSTGLPHILEHSVLCGSRKYPVKDPFVQLAKGSLNTFLNAMTFSDKTCYPVASQNLQDFYNLIDVYLDAVFYPRISPQILQQEGWHYELDDPEGEMVFKGVVFNEMKGAYSSPDSLLGRYTEQSLFPDTVYGVDSGGDPTEIPNLTYAQFKQFHETYYHPSNARIWFYGDDDPAERLRLIDSFIREFDAIDVNPHIPTQPRFTEPRALSYGYDPGEEAKTLMTVNWLLVENSDPETTLGLNILNHILVGTVASPLRKALIDSGLGEDLTGGGIDDQVREMYFSTGLKGIRREDVGRVEALIFEVLGKLAREGIETEMIEASMNTIEFRLREYNTGGYPRGLMMMIVSLSTWLYGQDPLAPLAFEAPLASIKARLAGGERFFESLIARFLLDNTHRTTVILEPDPALREREEAAERARLEAARAAMSREDIEGVVSNTQRLREMQERPDTAEDLATIPSLKLEDLDPQVRLIPTAHTTLGGAPVLTHDLFTNGIIYLDVGFNLHTLPAEYIPYISLFSQSLLGLGTQTEDYVKLSRRIGRKTGGLRPSAFISSRADSAESAAWLFLRGKGTADQTGDLLDIARDVLLTVNFDNRERFRQMLLEEKAGEESALVPRGHAFVNTRLKAQYSEADWVSEQMGGVAYIFFLRDLLAAVDNDWPGVRAKLEAMRQLLIQRGLMIVNVTTDAANWARFEPQLAAFVEAIPTGGGALESWQPALSRINEGLIIPAQVNYVGKGASLYDLGYQLHGSAFVISNYLRTSYLWDKIRVQGGAYGGFCTFDRHSGVFTFLSYRDPNLLKTIDNYDGASRFLREFDLNQDELVKGIIGTIGDMDAYQLPDSKGYTALIRHLLGDTDAQRQQRRDEVLGTTVADFRAFGELLAQLNGTSSVVVLGGRGAIEEANRIRPDWLKVQQVL